LSRKKYRIVTAMRNRILRELNLI